MSAQSYAQTRAEYRAIQAKAAELARALRKQGVRVPKAVHSKAYLRGATVKLSEKGMG
jgi:hypothetical protein